jgi:hypothetical protein
VYFEKGLSVFALAQIARGTSTLPVCLLISRRYVNHHLVIIYPGLETVQWLRRRSADYVPRLIEDTIVAGANERVSFWVQAFEKTVMSSPSWVTAYTLRVILARLQATSRMTEKVKGVGTPGFMAETGPRVTHSSWPPFLREGDIT